MARQPIRAFVFDAYGTLFDVHSVVDACRTITADAVTLSATWRQKQLEYTWLRALMRRYVDFWAVTEAALRASVRRLGLSATETQLAQLMDAYLTLACFPDVKIALQRLAPRPRAILSNGSPHMLQAAVASSGLSADLGHLISVDAVKTYKPVPDVYALGPKTLGLPAGEVLFVSSNAWDVAGAANFGLATFWINRGKQPMDELGFAADKEVDKITDLPALLKAA
jgi:2-haloacid dehalogenase